MASPSKRCTVEFRPGDSGYRFPDCSADVSSMICIGCCKNGSHPSHRFELQPALRGRSCVCGDTNVWRPSGCCALGRRLEASTCVRLVAFAGAPREECSLDALCALRLRTTWRDRRRRRAASRQIRCASHKPGRSLLCSSRAAGRAREHALPSQRNRLRGRDGRPLQLLAAFGDAPAPLGGGQESRDRPLPPATSAPGPSSLPTHLRHDLAHCCHIGN